MSQEIRKSKISSSYRGDYDCSGSEGPSWNLSDIGHYVNGKMSIPSNYQDEESSESKESPLKLK